jgi:hypothetical protein
MDNTAVLLCCNAAVLLGMLGLKETKGTKGGAQCGLVAGNLPREGETPQLVCNKELHSQLGLAEVSVNWVFVCRLHLGCAQKSRGES